MRTDRCPACGGSVPEADLLACRCSECGIVACERVLQPGRRFESVDQLRRALGSWAEDEGHDSADEFVEASFLDGDVNRVYERIRDGERVETSFDVLAFLFPEMAMASAIPRERPAQKSPVDVPVAAPAQVASSPAVAPGPGPEASPDSTPREPEPSPAVPTPQSRALDAIRGEPWAPLLPLVSVMVADGRIHPAEEAFLQRFLKANQCPPIPLEQVRVHRPHSVPTPPRTTTRERMIEAMIHLVHVDRLRDGSEFRVVEEYARAWGVDRTRVAHWDQLYRKRYATGVRRLWLILQSMFTRS